MALVAKEKVISKGIDDSSSSNIPSIQPAEQIVFATRRTLNPR
jgi:hypothetical protein